MSKFLAVLGLFFSMIIGLWQHYSRKASQRRTEAAKAKEDIDRANSEYGTTSDLLDGFGRLP